jgi:hypothetical protein
MHTTKQNRVNRHLYDVIFVYGTNLNDGHFNSFVVIPDLPKDEALKMVNYLNGGNGLPIGLIVT